MPLPFFTFDLESVPLTVESRVTSKLGYGQQLPVCSSLRSSLQVLSDPDLSPLTFFLSYTRVSVWLAVQPCRKHSNWSRRSRSGWSLLCFPSSCLCSMPATLMSLPQCSEALDAEPRAAVRCMGDERPSSSLCTELPM